MEKVTHLILSIYLINTLYTVGVVNSGKGMTSYQQRGKHVYAVADEK